MSKNISLLITALEQAEGITNMTSKKFDILAERISARTRQFIGASTLKRLWGYVGDQPNPRIVTLDILAQYIGYRSYADFLSLYSSDGDNMPSSNITFGTCIYTDEMEVGDTYRLTWAPNRVCDVEYQGDNTFVVKASSQTKLVEGTTFRCSVFEEGVELFLDYVFFTSHQKTPLNYLAGRLGGIRYEKIG